MGSGDGDSADTNGRSSGKSGWLDGVKGWDRGTRRRFLALLIATLSGVLTTVILYMNEIFEPTTDVDGPTSDGPRDALVQEYDSGYRAVYANGDLIEAGSDGWAVLETAIGAIPAGGTLFVRGRYEAASALEIGKSLRLDGHGATVTLRESADFAFDIRGEERYRTELAAGAETGDYTVELERTSDIEPGDLVLLEETGSPGVLGRGQPPGEPHSVLEVDGNTVTLEDTVVWRDGYEPGTLVYVVDPIEIRCTGFDMQAPAKDESYVGIIARNCRDSRFEELWLDEFGNRGIALEGCANSRVRDCTILQSADIEAANGYGIQIRAGCHDILVEGCTGKECRHPFSVTPAGPREVPSRSITVRDCFFSADGSAALNCHGGSAHDISFEGCMVHTWGQPGVRTGAQKTTVSGCEFRMDGHHAITTRNDGQEMVLTVTDTDVYGAANAVGLSDDEDHEFDPLWKLVHIDGVRANDCHRLFQLESGPVDRVRNLVIRNSSWDTVGEAGIRIENRLDGGSIEGNSFGTAPNDSHIRARDGESAVTNLHITGNRFRKESGEETFVRLSNATECVISGNEFESASDVAIYAAGSNSTRNVIKQNTYFAPGAAEDAIDEDDDSIATDNHFLDTG